MPALHGGHKTRSYRQVTASREPQATAAPNQSNEFNKVLAYYDKYGDWPGTDDPELGKLIQKINNQYKLLGNDRTPVYKDNGFSHHIHSQLRKRRYTIQGSKLGRNSTRNGRLKKAEDMLKAGEALPMQELNHIRQLNANGLLSRSIALRFQALGQDIGPIR